MGITRDFRSKTEIPFFVSRVFHGQLLVTFVVHSGTYHFYSPDVPILTEISACLE